MAPACGAQARRDLHGGAGRPVQRVVGVVPAVDRPGALLRHAVRGQHQAVLVMKPFGRRRRLSVAARRGEWNQSTLSCMRAPPKTSCGGFGATVS
ncbi:hypothetical protein PR202_ga01740 [Eleusine coracana subsp. coracana]|uniref:Uncharacterized protein n=1 Tax=Eleusine coracana subsp. coracana TaxID=191504 RepID=A0AAV5BFV7_ELECO|nr:hypothetical protein PR202_ga01053 [Eleusine coracana subsp. coracana]GJM85931.1 hypothetical protein PR202_ga01740 [Eleusine coracana subsp. coracana]